MSTVFLIGMPGVGKSHWGRVWSKAHDYPLYDLDDLIEQKAGSSIPTIMRGLGESGFRILESDVLLETVNAIRDKNAIVSCGGGTPTIEQNLRLMRRTGCVVYIQASTEILLQQLRQSAADRPLLRNLNAESIESLFSKRKLFYEQAHITIPLNKAEPGTFAEILQACTNQLW